MMSRASFWPRSGSREMNAALRTPGTACTAASERSPQLARQEIRDRAAGSDQIPRALDEQRGEVDLRCESASSARAFGAALPRRAPINGEVLFQSLARELGDAMNQMGGLPGLPGTGAKLPPGFQNFMNVKKK